MSNIVKLGMIFDSSTEPDFGSICQSTSNEYILLAADISYMYEKSSDTWYEVVENDG